MLKSFIVNEYPRIVLLLLFAWACLAALNLKAIFREFKGLISRRGAAIMGMLFAGALLGRLFLTPHTHQVYFDEFEHLNIASNLSRLGVYAESLAGGFADTDILDAPTWPAGFHVLLGLCYRLVGPSEAAAYNFNAVLGGLSVLLIALLAAHLFRDQASGVIAAFFWGWLALHFQFSGAADLTASSLFWVSAALLALSLYSRKGSFNLYLLLLSTLLCAAHTRFENIVLIPVSALFLHGLADRPWAVRAPRYVAAHAAFLGLLIPLVLLALNNRFQSLPGFGDSPANTLEHLLRNVPNDLLYFLKEPANLLVLIPGLIFALAKPTKDEAARHRMLIQLGLGYLFVYACFFRGDFNLGSENRYALAIYLPLVLLASRGFSSLPLAPRPKAAITLIAFWVFLLFSWPSYGRLPSEPFPQEYAFIKDSARFLPKDGYVVSFSPAAILVAADRPSISPYLFLNDRKAWDSAMSGGRGERLVLFKDFWWPQRKDDAEKLERGLRALYDFKPLVKRRVGTEEYAFDSLMKRAGTEGLLRKR